MLDKTVIRGDGKDSRFAAYRIKVESDKIFSEYGVEYIKEIAKLMMVEAIVSGKGPEEMDERIKSHLLKNISKAAYKIALNELRKLTGSSPQDFMKTVKQVLIGEGEAENEEYN